MAKKMNFRNDMGEAKYRIAVRMLPKGCRQRRAIPGQNAS